MFQPQDGVLWSEPFSVIFFQIFLNNLANLDSLVDMLYVLLIDRDS